MHVDFFVVDTFFLNASEYEKYEDIFSVYWIVKYSY